MPILIFSPGTNFGHHPLEMNFSVSYRMMSSNGFQKAKVCHSNTTQHSKLHQDKAQFCIQHANFDLKNAQKVCIIRNFITKNNLGDRKFDFLGYKISSGFASQFA